MPRTKNAKGIAKTKESENIQIEIKEKPPTEAKKRGRKPKGGKLITKNTNESDVAPVKTNVILHLKCSMKEIEHDIITNKNNLIGDPLNYNASIPPVVKAYDHTNDDNKFRGVWYAGINHNANWSTFMLSLLRGQLNKIFVHCPS